MNPNFQSPGSVASIKRLARAISSSTGQKYSDALEIAAERGGYNSFHDAVHSTSSAVVGKHSVTIVEYWRDASAKEAGTVKLEMKLNQPLPQLVKPHHLDGRLANFRLVNHDTLDGRTTLNCQESTAKWFAARTARTLQFMDATGLKPCAKDSGIWPQRDINSRIPDGDHCVTWYHPELKKYVATDEPYHGVLRPDDPERRAWCEKYGYVLQPVIWGGMHNPDPGNVGGTRLYLIAKAADNVPLNTLAATLNRLPPPVGNDVGLVSKRSIRVLR